MKNPFKNLNQKTKNLDELALISVNYYYREAKLTVKNIDQIARAVQPLFKLTKRCIRQDISVQFLKQARVANHYLNIISWNAKKAKQLLSRAGAVKTLVTSIKRDDSRSVKQRHFAIQRQLKVLKSVNQETATQQENVVQKYHQAVIIISNFKDRVNRYMKNVYQNSANHSKTFGSKPSDQANHSTERPEKSDEAKLSKPSRSYWKKGSKSDLDRGARCYLSGGVLHSRSDQFKRGYQQARAGFMSVLYPTSVGDHQQSNSLQYLTGQHFASYFLGGINDAKHRLTENPMLHTNVSYDLGYRAYRNGVHDGTRGQNQPDWKRWADNYQYAYKLAYRKAYRDYLKEFKAGQFAAQNDELAVSSLKDESHGYADGYVKEFRNKLSGRALELTSLGAIHVYRAPDLKKVVASYPQQKRAFRPIFKVTDVILNHQRQLAYRTTNGYLSTSPSNLTWAYYQDLNGSSLQLEIIQPAGTYLYGDKAFTPANRVRYLRYGSRIKVTNATVVNYHGVTCFSLGHGKYVSSQKRIVKIIK